MTINNIAFKERASSKLQKNQKGINSSKYREVSDTQTIICFENVRTPLSLEAYYKYR